MKVYINKILDKGYIRSSTLLYVALILIIKKLNGGLRIYIDYRTLNALIIKNKNTPLLIRETLLRLYIIKIFIKFDIIIAFNEIYIKEGNEEKIIFLTRYGLFKYIIIPFRLYNASNTF